MLHALLVAWLAALAVPQAAGTPLDVAALTTSAPVVVMEIDAGKLKGDPRQLAWAPDGQTLYLQTAEGVPPTFTLHHYSIALAGGALTPVEAEPGWAVEYWNVKQDRVAPGVPSLVLSVEQKEENTQAGPGTSPDAVMAGNPTPDNLASGHHGDHKAHVVRLRLLNEEVGVWIDEPFNAGMKFGWGPSGSGAIVHVDGKGQLVLFDQHRHRQVIVAVKDALLPAWTLDGTRLAYLQKTGRKTYAVAWTGVMPR
jgi:hypothetical protein